MTTLKEKLEALLDSEREALLQGDLERIGQIMEEKQALVDGIEESPDTVATLAPLQEKIRRNSDLFDHALAGIRSVVNRLGSLQNLRKSLETYDSHGQRLSVGENGENRLEKRA